MQVTAAVILGGIVPRACGNPNSTSNNRAMALARAVSDKALSREILDTVAELLHNASRDDIALGN